MRVLAMLLLSIVLGASGQLLFKSASRSLPEVAELGLLRMLLAMFTNPLILSGFACFFISAVLWIISLRHVALSVAYPMVALSYVIIFAGSSYLFGESVGWRHIAGAALIVAGILLINLRS